MSSSKLKIAHLVPQVFEKRFPFESNIRVSCGVLIPHSDSELTEIESGKEWT